MFAEGMWLWKNPRFLKPDTILQSLSVVPALADTVVELQAAVADFRGNMNSCVAEHSVGPPCTIPVEDLIKGIHIGPRQARPRDAAGLRAVAQMTRGPSFQSDSLPYNPVPDGLDQPFGIPRSNRDAKTLGCEHGGAGVRRIQVAGIVNPDPAGTRHIRVKKVAGPCAGVKRVSMSDTIRANHAQKAMGNTGSTPWNAVIETALHGVVEKRVSGELPVTNPDALPQPRPLVA